MSVGHDLRMYDGITHTHLVNLPRDVRELLHRPTCAATDEVPRLELSGNVPMTKTEVTKCTM